MSFIQVVSTTLSAVNDIMKVNQRVLAKAQVSRNTSTKIVRSLQRMSQSVAKDLNEANTSFKIADTNIAMTISLVKPDQQEQHMSVVSYRDDKDWGSETKIGIYNGALNSSIANNSAINGLITLPTDMLLAGNRTPVVSSISYSSGVFFLTDNQLEDIITDNKDRNIKTVVGGSVLSASIGDEDFINLSTPVTISFRNVSQSVGTGVVRFWDFEKGENLVILFYSILVINTDSLKKCINDLYGTDLDITEKNKFLRSEFDKNLSQL